MAETKRIMISLPNTLLEEIDGIVFTEKKNRSQFIREAMILYLKEQKKLQIREKLKLGYMEMAKINSELSENGVSNDLEDLNSYEALLTGSV